MTWIDIVCLIVVIFIVIAIISYMVYRRVKGLGEDCACAPLNGQTLVQKYHKAYGKKKGKSCHCGKE